MPTDAKCGLLVGVGLVLTVAVLFFQKDPTPADPPAPVAQAQSTPAAVKPPRQSPPSRTESALAPGRPVSRTASDDPLESRQP